MKEKDVCIVLDSYDEMFGKLTPFESLCYILSNIIKGKKNHLINFGYEELEEIKWLYDIAKKRYDEK